MSLKRIEALFNISNLLWLNLVLHLIVIGVVPVMIFDEQYYVPAAALSMWGQAYNYEHTPLAKLLVGLCIGVFGDWWFSWRILTIVMAVASVYVVYRISQHFMPDKYALVSAAFLSFDTLFFIHGSIFMLEVPAIMFGLVGILLYLQGRYCWMSVALSTSFLMKETGLFFLAIVIFTHIALKHKISRGNSDTWENTIKKSLEHKTFFRCTAIFAVISLGGLWLYDLAFKPGGISNPIEHLRYQYDAFTGILPMLHTPASEIRQPWSWILPVGDPFNAPFYRSWSILPTGFTANGRLISEWISQISITTSYFCLPILACAAGRLITKKGEPFDKMYVVWLLVTFAPWIIRALIVPMRYNFYFLYTVPVLCIGIGHLYSKMPSHTRFGETNFYLRMHLIAAVLFFLLFYPLKIGF